MPELIWDGKYDKDGRRAAPPRIALPFQTVETVNESAQERQHTLDLFSSGRDAEWRNRLIWGDKKYVLSALLDEFSGSVDLIYIDPPFYTGADFSLTARVPDSDTQFLKEPTIIEQKAYRDTWKLGLDSYLSWFYATVVMLRDLLKDTGSLYVHLDWHVGHYAKVVMDEIFGESNFRNEVIWSYRKLARTSGQFPKSHDTLFFYTKTQTNVFNVQFVELSESTLKRWGDRKRGGKDPRERYITEEESPGAVMPDTWDIPLPIGANPQKTGYPTQKPELLLERIIQASSNQGDLVLDCFVGSGTTSSVAERLNRRWIAADLSRFAIHTTRKRLLSIPNVRPFVVQNLGKYERQAWQVSEFGEGAELRYRRFILELYRAQPLSGYVWLHGIRGGTFVHVGSVDAPVTVGDVKQIVLEHRRAIGTGAGAPTTNRIDLLGWDFAFELNEVAKQQAALANVDFHFVRIPREVLEKRAVEQGDIAFYELAALAVDVRQKDRTVTLQLTDFVIPLDDVPEDVQRAVTHWTQWIDYWAVDWDNNDDTFHNQWQTYRTRKDPSLQKSAVHSYEEPGCYTIVVKVIDILGNDSTKTLTVEVP